MKQKKVLDIAATMSIDEIGELMAELRQLRGKKVNQQWNLREKMLCVRKDIHPVCKV